MLKLYFKMNLLTLFSHFKLNLKKYLYLKFKIFDIRQTQNTLLIKFGGSTPQGSRRNPNLSFCLYIEKRNLKKKYVLSSPFLHELTRREKCTTHFINKRDCVT